ncbi:MAG TPA: DNA/RNA nuclease SfsA [Roseovarius sp.]
MRFQTPLASGVLLRRYKRFLADVRLPGGREVVAHCANPGRMTGLAEPGTRVWVEPNDDPKKKLNFAWRLAELPGGHLACIDTAAANRVVGEALRAGQVPGLTGYGDILPEQRYGERSRVDFLLRASGQPNAYVEVKSVTLSRRDGLAEFPDTRTERGARHLSELAEIARSGQRAVLLYLVQRTDCAGVATAADIDPVYAAALTAARAAGVEIMAHVSVITPSQITLGAVLPYL